MQRTGSARLNKFAAVSQMAFRCIDGREAGGRSMRPVESLAIIGAGNMGSGIAQKSAQELFEVQMIDREQQLSLIHI